MRANLLVFVVLLALAACSVPARKAVEHGPLFAPDELAAEGAEGDAALDRTARHKSYCEGLRDGGQRWSPEELPDESLGQARAELLSAFECDGRQPLLVIPAEAEAGRSFAAAELADEELRLRLAQARARLAAFPEADERRVLAEQLLFELSTKSAGLQARGVRLAEERARLGLASGEGGAPAQAAGPGAASAPAAVPAPAPAAAPAPAETPAD